jgi:sec-independent protein translocase protein TatB
MMGRAMGEFRKATSELKESIDPDNSLSDVKKAFTEMNQSVSNSVYDAMRAQEEAPKATPATDPPPEHPAASDPGDTKRV